MVIRKDVIAVAAVFFIMVGLVSTAFIVGSAKEAETMENNDTLTKKYEIPSNASSGRYDVDIFVNDSYREYSTSLSFLVGGEELIVSPLEWIVSTDQSGTETKEFTITNGGLETLNNINITEGGELEPYIALTKNNISSLEPDDSETFTAYLNVSLSGNHTGNITVESDDATAVITIELNYTAGAQPQSQLTITPNFISEVTVPGKLFDKNLTLKNKDNVTAINIVEEVIGTAADVLTIVSKPSTLIAQGTGDMVTRIDTTGVSTGTYSGSIKINSSVGSASATVNIEVIGNLVTESDLLLIELESYQQNITDLRNRGKNTTEVETIYSEIEVLISDAKISYQAEEYETAKQKYDSASSKLNTLKSKINTLETEQEPPADYSLIIWVFAIVIIVGIVGITFLKYRDKLKDLINKILKKKPKEKPKEEKKEEEEYYYPTGEEEEYRTEYY